MQNTEQTAQSMKAKTYIPGETKDQRKARKRLEKAPAPEPVKQELPPSNDKHIVCLKWGNKYSSEYVNKLNNMCKRHTQQNIKFHCFTENTNGIDKDITTHPLPDIPRVQGWWYKPWFFSNELPFRGTLLFLDLDVVICDNLDKFFDYEPTKDFVVIRDFNRSMRARWDRINSSVFRMHIGSRQSQYTQFISQKDSIVHRMPGDQDWMYRNCRPWEYWPEEWVRSYKWEMRDRRDLELKNGVRNFKTIGYPTIMKDQSIAVFHGRPNPSDCNDPWVIENWR